MTNPLGASAADESDATRVLSQYMQGSQSLKMQPGVVYALAQQQAHPADAQAIGQYMDALDVNKRIELARAAGSKIILSANDQQLANSLGTTYSDVQYTAAEEKAAAQQQPNNGPLTQQQQAAETSKFEQSLGMHQYKAKGIGRVFHAINNDVLHPIERDVLHPVGEAFTKGWNAANTAIAEGPMSGSAYDPGGRMYQDMKANGYDPSSVMSRLAFAASGKAHTDLSSLDATYGSANVDEALKFLNNPAQYRKQIEQKAAANPADDAAQAEWQRINSTDFETLARRVSAKSATIGNDAANAMGLDPIKHPTLYGVTTAGINLAASFALDPTILAGRVVNGVKMSQIGMDGIADTSTIGKVLTGAQKGVFASARRAQAQNFLDMAARARQAAAEGDEVKEASIVAQINAQHPEWAPILEDVNGVHQLTHPSTWKEVNQVGRDGKILTDDAGNPLKQYDPATMFGRGNAITNTDELSQYLESKVALARLMNGRAATQASVMPGAMSTYGYRVLKGKTAGWMTSRSGERMQDAYGNVISAAQADPELANKLITEGMLRRIGPQADDAVDTFTGLSLTPAGKGAVQQSLRGGTAEYSKYAVDADGQITSIAAKSAINDVTKAGRFSPSAIAARNRMIAQRLSTLLPRNTVFDINDNQTGEKIRKFALTYLNRGDANALLATWNRAGGGQRKQIISGLIDQVGHAAGLPHSQTGRDLLDSLKTQVQSYSSTGDEITLNGSNLALHGGQTQNVFVLPSFQTLQQASRKIGLYESTMGRAMTSSQADALMGQWKMFMLAKPSTISRNMLEGGLNAALRGDLGDALKAKAAAVKAGLFDGQELGRSVATNKLAQFYPFAKMGQAYTSLVGRTMSDAELAEIEKLDPGVVADLAREYGQQVREAALGERGRAMEADQIAGDGMGPVRLKRVDQNADDKASRLLAETKNKTPKQPKRVVWTEQDVDGHEGADRYEFALRSRVDDTPGIAQAVISRLRNPDSTSLDDVVKAMDDAAKNTKFKNTDWGKVTWDDPLNGGDARRALNADEVAAGKREWAQRVIDDYNHLLTTKDGSLSQKVMDHIEQHKQGPTSDWIRKNLKSEDRPINVRYPQNMAMAPGEEPKQGVFNALLDWQGNAYKWAVERPLQRMVTMPVFLSHYARTKVALSDAVDELQALGHSESASEHLAQELAFRQAWMRAEETVDDPGQKAQFDVMARNMFPFARATQAMIRRWGSALWQNPVRARKMMLTYEAAQHSGFIYNNAYGEPTFNYPGSGVMNMLMHQVSKIPGMENFASMPISANMTGGVLMSVPGADNPLRMAMGPMLTIPLREITGLAARQGIGTQSMYDQIDSWINGPIGTGQTFSQLEPAVVKKFYTNMDEGNRNTALASSMVGAIANLAAAGYLPDENASPAQLQQFYDRLKTQVHNQLIVRAVFGIFAPAPPSAPSEGTSGSGSDYTFKMSGIAQLSDEYRTILNDVNGNVAEANMLFAEANPDKIVVKTDGSISGTSKLYSAETQAKTQTTTTKAFLPTTATALNWFEGNRQFIKKYQNVAAYFLPQSASEGEFNDRAYNTEIELGLRQRKTPQEFYNTLVVRNAEGLYYPAVQGFDDRISAAKAAGDQQAASTWTTAKSNYEKQFKAQNPLFGAKIDSYPDARALAVRQLSNLKQMIVDNEVPNGQGPRLAQLILNYEGLTNFANEHKGNTTTERSARSWALAQFNNWATANIKGTPLADLYTGIFKVLNTNLVAVENSPALAAA